MKTCTKCHETKETALFIKNKPLCRACHAAYMRNYLNKPGNREKQNQRVKNHPNRQLHLSNRLAKKYGFEDGAALDAFRKEHKGLCPICQENEATDIDHCHKTMTPRGLICGWCNFMIGQSKDSAATLRRAADYLDRHPGSAI